MAPLVLYDTVTQILRDAAKDIDFVRKNTVLQDKVLADELQVRINSLTPDINFVLDATNVVSQTGLLTTNTKDRNIIFDPTRASGYKLSGFREGIIQNPGKLTLRVPPNTYPLKDKTLHSTVRYFLCDELRGVFLLDENLNVVKIFPGFAYGSLTPTPAQYDTPRQAISYVESGVEYVAIACYGLHVVQIYRMDDFSFVSTVGTFNVQGLPPLGLTNPTGVAYDAVGGKLYISCERGQPLGATANRGFVAVNTTLAGLTLLPNARYVTNGSISRNEVDGPKGIFYSYDELWLVCSNNEAGALNTVDGTAVKYIPATGSGYKLSGLSDISVKRELVPGDEPTPASYQSEPVFPLRLTTATTFHVRKDGKPAQYKTDLLATPAVLVSAPASYGLAIAGDHLDLEISIYGQEEDPVTQVITFAGTENSQITYLSTIALQIAGALVTAVTPTTFSLTTVYEGAFASINVLPTSSPNVMTSLGLSYGIVPSLGPNSVSSVDKVTAFEIGALLKGLVPSTDFSVSEDESSLTFFGTEAGEAKSLEFLKTCNFPTLVAGFDYFVHRGSEHGPVATGRKTVYLANGGFGNVVTFDVETNAVQSIYGTKSVEDDLLSNLPTPLFSKFGLLSGLCADGLSIGGVYKNVMCSVDSSNVRVLRIDEDSYLDNNSCVFTTLKFLVPVRIKAWAIVGSIPNQAVEVYYQASFAYSGVVSPTWTLLTQNTTLEPVTEISLMLKVRLSSDMALQKMTIDKLLLLTEQE